MEKISKWLANGMLSVGAVLVAASLFGILKGLYAIDWNVAEMARQYLVSVGAIGDFETLVDFYTHIKGVEYILAVSFLGAFPVFFRSLNKSSKRKTISI